MLESLSRQDHGAQELMVEPIGPSVPGWVDDQSVPQDVRQAWINNGFTVLHGVIGAEAVVKYNATVAKVRTEIEEGKDEYGYGERIGQLHQKYQDPNWRTANESCSSSNGRSATSRSCSDR